MSKQSWWSLFMVYAQKYTNLIIKTAGVWTPAAIFTNLYHVQL